MNKTEQNLVDAIEGGDYDKANKALSKFTVLKSTTDEQSNEYFDKVEALLVVVDEEAIIDETELSEEDKEEDLLIEEVVVVAPRPEYRGLKPKSKSRKDVEKAFYNALESAVNFQADNRRGENARFARRLVQRLTAVRKQVLR